MGLRFIWGSKICPKLFNKYIIYLICVMKCNLITFLEQVGNIWRKTNLNKMSLRPTFQEQRGWKEEKFLWLYPSDVMDVGGVAWPCSGAEGRGLMKTGLTGVQVVEEQRQVTGSSGKYKYGAWSRCENVNMASGLDTTATFSCRVN